MKRSLPTVQSGPAGHGKSGRRTGAPRERLDPPVPLVTVGWVNHAREAGQLALQLCAALSEKGLPPAVLLASEGSEPLPNASLGQFLEAGARAAKWVNLPAQGEAKLLAAALEELAGAPPVLALGNAPAEFYRPLFSIVVSGHRRQRITDDAQLMQADLEITTPSDAIAHELASLLAGRIKAPAR
ncbi:MAG TPA: hypothetical protein VJR89_30570 [Polyangiales bacterium]|nr:hypothetical protein [Polyangiales bacterium]